MEMFCLHIVIILTKSKLCLHIHTSHQLNRMKFFSVSKIKIMNTTNHFQFVRLVRCSCNLQTKYVE